MLLSQNWSRLIWWALVLIMKLGDSLRLNRNWKKNSVSRRRRVMSHLHQLTTAGLSLFRVCSLVLPKSLGWMRRLYKSLCGASTITLPLLNQSQRSHQQRWARSCSFNLLLTLWYRSTGKSFLTKFFKVQLLLGKPTLKLRKSFTNSCPQN